MTYLLDSNVFITAKNSYYDPMVFPAFWDWLLTEALAGNIASTDLVYDELKKGGDDLARWAQTNKKTVFSATSSSQATAANVAKQGAWAVGEGYKTHVIADFMSGADPFLVATAAAGALTIVSLERPAGSGRKKIKIPDVCDLLAVDWIDTFEMMRRLGAKFA